MELIPVNSQKLKIILTKDDMASFDITNQDLDYSSAKTRKALGNILEKAKAEAGFEAGHDKLYIQVFLSLDGGCEMFFTKRTKLLPEPETKSCTYFRRKSGYSPDYSREYGKYIAKSENIDCIIELCIRLKKEGFYGTSSLCYINDEYILKIDLGKISPYFSGIHNDLPDFSHFSFICDYCNVRYADPIPSAYIDEHAKVLIKESAVEAICENFGDKSMKNH